MPRKYAYECNECGKSHSTDDEEGGDVYMFSFQGSFGLMVGYNNNEVDLDDVYLCPGCVAQFFQKRSDEITKEAAVKKLKGQK